ncbi:MULTISPECIES: mechanosensitive ion channel domain-containing protein [Haloferax]|uniref:Mechanosensitive ion channel n=1 Tax=Haloferax marinum TaxID=2666143 RepID=A0A6A8G8Q6_9EURY|nr:MULTISPECIES: mechanosensitive ion channel domain-containing protein [Haloferax]KAB1197611.1 mechanosensitive ion channel [Haloferax sp. CBA1150]MRW96663.1 mechanosensitive ion channel [Haloferax marinum]
MLQTVTGFLLDTLETTLVEFGAVVRDATPKILTGLVFVGLAYVGIKAILYVLRGALDGIYPEEQELVVDLGVAIAGVFLWFGAALSLLNIVGMTEIAASLGTAAGFIALGVSYALSNMIADTVAGVYLLRDPDFNPGDRVKSDPVTGTVTAIELRKTRFENDEGDTVVVANRDVEKKWTKYDEMDATTTAAAETV